MTVPNEIDLIFYSVIILAADAVARWIYKVYQHIRGRMFWRQYRREREQHNGTI